MGPNSMRNLREPLKKPKKMVMDWQWWRGLALCCVLYLRTLFYLPKCLSHFPRLSCISYYPLPQRLSCDDGIFWSRYRAVDLLHCRVVWLLLFASKWGNYFTYVNVTYSQWLKNELHLLFIATFGQDSWDRFVGLYSMVVVLQCFVRNAFFSFSTWEWCSCASRQCQSPN
jgi:hypothetical protein